MPRGMFLDARIRPLRFRPRCQNHSQGALGPVVAAGESADDLRVQGDLFQDVRHPKAAAKVTVKHDSLAAVVDLVRAFEVLCDVVDVEGIAESMFAYMRS